jgi:hypothetical protein
MRSQGGAFLPGLFSLADGATEQSFLAAFHAFYGHPAEIGFVCGYHVTRHQPLGGFGAKLPAFAYHVEIAFPSPAHDQAWYDCVRRNDEPVRSLHRAMNTQVKRGSADFFLTMPIAGGTAP